MASTANKLANLPSPRTRRLELANVQLSEDLTCGGERSMKTAFASLTFFGTTWRFSRRQGEIFRKRAVMRNDAEYRTPGTMRLQPTPAECAHRLKAIAEQTH